MLLAGFQCTPVSVWFRMPPLHPSQPWAPCGLRWAHTYRHTPDQPSKRPECQSLQRVLLAAGDAHSHRSMPKQWRHYSKLVHLTQLRSDMAVPRSTSTPPGNPQHNSSGLNTMSAGSADWNSEKQDGAVKAARKSQSACLRNPTGR